MTLISTLNVLSSICPRTDKVVVLSQLLVVQIVRIMQNLFIRMQQNIVMVYITNCSSLTYSPTGQPSNESDVNGDGYVRSVLQQMVFLGRAM